MGRKAQELPDCFAVVTTDTVRCTVCNDPPIKRASWKKHFTADKHTTAVALHEEKLERQQREDARRAEIYNLDTSYDLSAFEDHGREHINMDATLPGPSHQPVRQGGVTAEDMQGFLASAPEESHAERAQRLANSSTTILQVLERLYDENEDTDPDDDATTAFVQSTVVNDIPVLSVADIHAHVTGTRNDNQRVDMRWWPYKDKITFMLDLLDSLPRLRLSNAQMEMILWVLKECGVQNTPTLNRLRETQKDLRSRLNLEPTQHRSVANNVFYTNDPRITVSMDFGNPQVASHMVFYPEISNTVSEAWHTPRWREFPRRLLSPMYAAGLQHYYVDEIARTQGGNYVVPLMWITRHGVLHCDAYTCEVKDGRLRVVTDAGTGTSVPVSELEACYKQMEAEKSLPELDDDSADFGKPNPLRDIANGRPIYTVFLDAWADDVSGNVSKQYNKHINLYLANRCLPSALLQQEFFVRFFSTSPHASASEQFAALRKIVLETHDKPVETFDARIMQTCLFRILVPTLPGDNPQQSDDCSHMGGQALCNCRKCKNSRAIPSDPSNTGWYTKNFAPSEPRTVTETCQQLQEQITVAFKGVRTKVTSLQRKTGTKDSLAEYWIERIFDRLKELKDDKSRKWTKEEMAENVQEWLETQDGDYYNPLLDWSGLDPHQDTPVEILHTILLGLVKYIWHDLHTSWTPRDRDCFTLRLQCSDDRGLGEEFPKIRAAYIMQYRNGLIGKHFKIIDQLGLFHLHGIASAQQFTLFKAAAFLSAHLWIAEIEDMEAYLADLQILIDNVLDAYADIDPTRILYKIKLHLLSHLPPDIRRFGSAVRFATEIFECFNAIFRMCSVLSNHQAPSRDIARSIAGMDRMKHIISGGFWYDTVGGVSSWRQAGEGVRTALFDNPIIQRHLGWKPRKPFEQGTVRRLPLSGKNGQPNAVAWTDLKAATATLSLHPPASSPELREASWWRGTHITAASGDVCDRGTWVVYSGSQKDVDSNPTDVAHIGRILEIAERDQSTTTVQAIVTVEMFALGEQRHPDFDMPVLTRLENRREVVSSKALQFAVNVQHDCRTGKCDVSDMPEDQQAILQERVATGGFKSIIKHSDDSCFVLNLAAFHNAARLRKALPSSLVRPVHIFPNRAEMHLKWEAEARKAMSQKKARSREKAAETRKRKREAKERAVNPSEETVQGEGPPDDGENEPEDDEMEEEEAFEPESEDDEMVEDDVSEDGDLDEDVDYEDEEMVEEEDLAEEEVEEPPRKRARRRR